MNRTFLTKINPPQARQLLSRQRLLESLERCRDYRLLLISAATGFGKTSLLVDFARHSDMALAWYTLDESDRDPATFCRFLLQSVRLIYPSFGQSFQQLLEQNLKELHQEPIIYRLAEEFIADLELLEQNSAEDFRETLLVLDDFQFAESFGVNRFVQRLIWWLPPAFHVIIATRALPEDLMLNKMLAKQMMSVLGPADLVFSAAEVNQLLRDYYEIDEPALGERLATYSEGWITAIILALSNQNLIRSGAGWQDLKSADGEFDAAQIFNYLALEVLENQPTHLQNFLLRTSVLNLLSPANCDALLDKSDGEAEPSSEAFLRQLEARNLFITRLSSEGQVYFQYHALFRQFLHKRLKENRSLYYEVQLQAAQIEQQAGNYAEAVQHYIEANEIQQAAALLSEIVGPLYEAGRTNLLNNLLATIPSEEQRKLPHLLNIKAQLLLEKGNNEAALKTYAEAEQLYRQEGALDLAAKAAAQQAQLLVRTGQRREAIAICGRVLQDFASLMQTSEGQRAVGMVKHVSAFVAMEEGNIVEAEKNLRDAAEIYKACKDDFRLATIDSVFGQLYNHAGRLVKSSIYHERALAYFVKIGNRSREAYIRTSLAIIRYQQGQYLQAENQFNETLTLTQDLDDAYLRLFVLAYLGNIYRDTERYSKAEATYAEALKLARDGNIRKMELSLLNEQITNFILTGQTTDVADLILLSLELAEDYAMPERVAFAQRNQSWLELGNRSYKRALVAIEKALGGFRIYKAPSEEARAKLTEATILLAMNEPRKALAVLEESIALAEDLNFEPYLPFEIRWATPLFEYASHKKVSEAVSEFLRRRGFISGLEAASPAKDEEGRPELVAPIQLRERLAQNNLNRAAEAALAPSSNSTVLRVSALNGGRVWRGDSEIEQWRTSKAREALFYLLEYSKCSRDELWEALWPDEDFGTSSNLLNTNMSYLRKAIAPVAELKLSSGRYFLQGEIWYDAAEFSSQVKMLLAQPELDAERLTKALNLYKRDFLDQFYSNWSIERQQQLLQLYLTGLERLALHYDHQNQPQLALPCWRQMLLKDPYNEETHRACILSLMKAGDKLEARRQSARCLRALEELDLRPSPETAHLLQKLA